MNTVKDWIKNHQIAAFFIITFTITWGLGFSYRAVLVHGKFLLAPLVSVATCGPALAGIIIAAISNTQPRQGTRKAFWIAFFVAWVVSALVLLAYNTFISLVPLSSGMVGFALVVVVPVAFVISMAYSRIPAVKSYLSSLIRLRGVWGWALLALVLLPGPVLLSVAISKLLGRQPIVAFRLPETGLALVGLIAVKFSYQLFFFNVTGEEAGWRGFALPRLQARTSPLIAAFIISIFWAPWHFFLCQAEGNPVLTLQFWIDMYIGTAGTILPSLIIVWICNRAKGSILVAGIAHAAINTAFAFVSIQDGQALKQIWFAIALVMIVADRMWKKLPSDHPAVYRKPGMIRFEKNISEEILEVSHV
jgi:membrane protease YdiL (CAAX protease family)